MGESPTTAIVGPGMLQITNENLNRLLRGLTIARNAVSLGGVESLACHPLTTTHSELDAGELAQAGINDSMVRVSVGSMTTEREHVEALWKVMIAEAERG